MRWGGRVGGGSEMWREGGLEESEKGRGGEYEERVRWREGGLEVRGKGGRVGVQ